MSITRLSSTLPAREYTFRVEAARITPSGRLYTNLMIRLRFEPTTLSTSIAKCLGVKEPEELMFEKPYESFESLFGNVFGLGDTTELVMKSPTGRLRTQSPELQNVPSPWATKETEEIYRAMADFINHQQIIHDFQEAYSCSRQAAKAATFGYRYGVNSWPKLSNLFS